MKKRKRREEIFQYVEYLRKEKLYDYLQCGVIFLDERVLTPSYAKYRDESNRIEKVNKLVNGKSVILPLNEYRKKMSVELLDELNQISMEEKINYLKKIKKIDLELYAGKKYLVGTPQIKSWIVPIERLKIIGFGMYKDAKNKGTIKNHLYKSKNDLEFEKYIDYVFVDMEDK